MGGALRTLCSASAPARRLPRIPSIRGARGASRASDALGGRHRTRARCARRRRQRGVAGADVIAPGESGAPIERRTTTGANGTFTFVDVPDGDYALSVEAPGFQTWTRTVTVRAARAALDITLEVAGVSEGVTVAGTTPLGLSTPVTTASRLGLTPLETPASVAVISGETIRDLGTPTLIVAKSLAPGVTSSAPMGSGGNILNARGFTGTEFGEAVVQRHGNLQRRRRRELSVRSLERRSLDTLYGPASVLYGSGAIGGAVNVVPKRPDPRQRRHDATISIGSFGTYHGAVGSTGPINERLSYRVDASQYTSDHWVERGDSTASPSPDRCAMTPANACASRCRTTSAIRIRANISARRC